MSAASRIGSEPRSSVVHKSKPARRNVSARRPSTDVYGLPDWGSSDPELADRQLVRCPATVEPTFPMAERGPFVLGQFGERLVAHSGFCPRKHRQVKPRRSIPNSGITGHFKMLNTCHFHLLILLFAHVQGLNPCPSSLVLPDLVQSMCQVQAGRSSQR